MACGVLVSWAMTRLGLAALLVAASAPAASAGTYVGLGIGTGASGRMGDAETVDGTERSGRLTLGRRFSRLSVEGQASRFAFDFTGSHYRSTQLAAALKLSIPLGNNFELFGRGGLQRTWLTHADPSLDATGNGLLLGGGVEYRLNLGVTGASLFMDYQRSSMDLTNNRMAIREGVMSMWTIGATVSL